MIADLSAAACAGADPSIFDHCTFPEAADGLAICAVCPIPDLCLEAVRPSRSHFDGIAGAAVWRNGYRVRADNSTREDRQRRKECHATPPSPAQSHAQRSASSTSSQTKKTLGPTYPSSEPSAAAALCSNPASTTPFTSVSSECGAERSTANGGKSAAAATSNQNPLSEGSHKNVR